MELDERALIFSLIVAMGSALLFGMGPAVATTRMDLSSAIRATDSALRGRWRFTGRATLVATQVALSMVLITIAVFTLQIFRRVSTNGPGFHVTQVAKVSVDTAHRRYSDRQTTAFVEQALDAARRLPNVTSASVTSRMPLWGLDVIEIAPEGAELLDGQRGVNALVASVDGDYFQTIGIPVLRGRTFRSTDIAGAPRVAIVNEALARRHWPDHDAVGRRFRVVGEDDTWVQVVGVARNSKYAYIVEPQQEALDLPFQQQPRGGMVLLARTARDRSPPSGRSATSPATSIRSSRSSTRRPLRCSMRPAPPASLTMATEMVGGIGAMGTMLTMVGLYSLVSHSVLRRTREIGIRMAIGATYRHVLAMILQQGMEPAWFGIPVGLVLSTAATRSLPSIFPTADRYEPRTFLVIVPLLLVVALLAAFVPARRAALVDPTMALRHE